MGSEMCIRDRVLIGGDVAQMSGETVFINLCVEWVPACKDMKVRWKRLRKRMVT